MDIAVPATVKQNLYSVKIATYKATMTRKPSTAKDRARPAPGKAAARAGRRANQARSAAAGAGEARPIITARCATRCSRRRRRCWSATGFGGLTLRAVAREAGVSHAAPTHHFGDLTGLVSELAAIGFRQFNAAMAAAGAIDAPPLLERRWPAPRPMSPMRRRIPACTG